MAASGVAIDDEVVTSFNKMKVQTKQKEGCEKRPAYILFGFNDNQSKIIVTETGPEECSYQQFRDVLEKTGPTYAVYDFCYETNLGQPKKVLFFVTWCPEFTKIKMRMIISSSKDALKNKLVGFQYELQANDADEISFESFHEKIKDAKRN